MFSLLRSEDRIFNQINLKMRYIKTVGAALTLLLFSFGTLRAQASMNQKKSAVNSSSITNQELKTFIKASNDIQAIQMGSVKEIQKAVKSQGMKLQRFRQIMMSKRNPKQDSVKMTPKEQKEFANIRQSIMQIETNVNKKIVAKIKSDDMQVSRYKQIYMALQQSKPLQKRLRSIASKQK